MLGWLMIALSCTMIIYNAIVILYDTCSQIRLLYVRYRVVLQKKPLAKCFKGFTLMNLTCGMCKSEATKALKAKKVGLTKERVK